MWQAQFGHLVSASKASLSLAQPLPLWLQCSFFHFPGAGPREPQGARNECAAPHTLHFSFQVLNVSFAFELMQDGGLEKPKPRPEGTLLFPGFVARGKTLPCNTGFHGREHDSCLIPEGRLSSLKPSLWLQGKVGQGAAAQFWGSLVSCRLHSHGGKKKEPEIPRVGSSV